MVACKRGVITSIPTASPQLAHRLVDTLWLCWAQQMKCATLKVMEAIKVSPAWIQSLLISTALLHCIDPATSKEKKGPFDTNTRLIGGTFEEKRDVWVEASPITHVNSKSAPVLFISSSSYRPFQQREEMRDKLKALGIVSEMVVIPDTPHPFCFFIHGLIRRSSTSMSSYGAQCRVGRLNLPNPSTVVK
jgi:hypothetical protein